MAEKIGEFYYTVTADGKIAISELNKIEKAGQKTGDQIGAGMGKMFAGIAAGFLSVTAAFNFLKESITQFIAKSQIISVLDNALKSVGSSYKEMRGEIDAMSKTNAVEDEKIAQVISYGVAMGISKDKLMEFAQASIDYAAQTGKGLEMAMRMVATTAKKGGDEFEKLKERVKGAGAAAGDADKGWTRLNITIGDLKAAIGELISTELAGWIKELTELLDKLLASINKYNELTQAQKLAGQWSTVADKKGLMTAPMDAFDKNKSALTPDQYKMVTDAGAWVQSKNIFGGTFWQIDVNKFKAWADAAASVEASKKKIVALSEQENKLTDADKAAKKEVEDQIKRQLDLEKAQAEQWDEIRQNVIDTIPALKDIGINIKDFQGAFEIINKLIADGEEGGDALEKVIGDPTGWAEIIKIVQLVAGAFDAIGKAIGEAFNNNDGMKQQRAIIDSLTAELAQYQRVLERINAEIAWFKLNVEKEEIGMARTEENINEKIKNRKGLIDQNTEAMARYNAVYDAAVRKYGADLPGAREGVSGRLAEAERMRAEIVANVPDKVWGGIFRGMVDNEQKKSVLNQIDLIISNLKAEITNLDTAIAAKTAALQLDTDNAQLAQDILDLEQEKLDIINEQAQAQADIYAAMQDQTRELLKQKGMLGIYDFENVGDIMAAINELRASGLSGLALAEAAAGLGISNQAIRSTRIGSVIYNSYNASNNSANINGVLDNQIGE